LTTCNTSDQNQDYFDIFYDTYCIESSMYQEYSYWWHGETVLTVTNWKIRTDKYYVSLEISYIQLEQFRPDIDEAASVITINEC